MFPSSFKGAESLCPPKHVQQQVQGVQRRLVRERTLFTYGSLLSTFITYGSLLTELEVKHVFCSIIEPKQVSLRPSFDVEPPEISLRPLPKIHPTTDPAPPVPPTQVFYRDMSLHVPRRRAQGTSSFQYSCDGRNGAP